MRILIRFFSLLVLAAASAAPAQPIDLPDAELHLLDGGHWLLETNLEAAALIRDFLARVHVG